MILMLDICREAVPSTQWKVQLVTKSVQCSTQLWIFQLLLSPGVWWPSTEVWVALWGSLSAMVAVFMAFSLGWGGRYNQFGLSNSYSVKARCWNSCDSIIVYCKDWKAWYCWRLYYWHPLSFGTLQCKSKTAEISSTVTTQSIVLDGDVNLPQMDDTKKLKRKLYAYSEDW